MSTTIIPSFLLSLSPTCNPTSALSFHAWNTWIVGFSITLHSSFLFSFLQLQVKEQGVNGRASAVRQPWGVNQSREGVKGCIALGLSKGNKSCPKKWVLNGRRGQEATLPLKNLYAPSPQSPPSNVTGWTRGVPGLSLPSLEVQVMRTLPLMAGLLPLTPKGLARERRGNILQSQIIPLPQSKPLGTNSFDLYSERKMCFCCFCFLNDWNLS